MNKNVAKPILTLKQVKSTLLKLLMFRTCSAKYYYILVYAQARSKTLI